MQIITERCAQCGSPFTEPDAPKHYGEQQVARQQNSPAEWIEVGPFCDSCWLYSLPELDAQERR